MKIYIHKKENWTDFTWDNKKVMIKLGEVRNLQGKLLGKMESLGFDLQNEAVLNTLTLDVIKSSEILSKIFHKAEFWKNHSTTILNDRQQKIINRLLDGFDGKLTTSKWARINKCSQDTALRDIQDLIKKDVLQKKASGGRSTNYELKLMPGDNTRHS